MVLPPDNKPRELRGVQVLVTFWVDASGRVAKVELDPPIKDHKYAERFTEAMQGYKFRPAVGPDGVPIASIYTITVNN
jgi:TonB family protein